MLQQMVRRTGQVWRGWCVPRGSGAPILASLSCPQELYRQQLPEDTYPSEMLSSSIAAESIVLAAGSTTVVVEYGQVHFPVTILFHFVKTV